jgi:hypothetical protein
MSSRTGSGGKLYAPCRGRAYMHAVGIRMTGESHFWGTELIRRPRVHQPEAEAFLCRQRTGEANRYHGHSKSVPPKLFSHPARFGLRGTAARLTWLCFLLILVLRRPLFSGKSMYLRAASTLSYVGSADAIASVMSVIVAARQSNQTCPLHSDIRGDCTAQATGRECTPASGAPARSADPSRRCPQLHRAAVHSPWSRNSIERMSLRSMKRTLSCSIVG